MLFTNNLLYDLTGLLVAFFAIFLAYAKWSFGYWQRRGLRSSEPTIPFGNVKDLILGKKTIGEIYQDTYFDLKSQGQQHGGSYFFFKPMYVVVDLNFVKSILQTDFQHFWGHGMFVNENADPLSANVFNLEGPKWKSIRVKLTPTFTSGKMKMMFQTLVTCANGLEDLLDQHPKDQPVDIKDVIGRLTTDIISSCAFGIECNTLQNPNSDFRKYGKMVFSLDILGFIRQFATLLVPHWLLTMINFKVTKQAVIDFFYNVVVDTINYREKNNIIRKDFMHMLLQIKNRGTMSDEDVIGEGEGKSEGTLTVDEIAAQCYIFFLAGFETSSTTVNWASLELATNLDVQKKAREEISQVLAKYDDKITYEAVMEMTYLENIISETLRKYPPIQNIFRRCNKEYRIPDTDVIIEEGIQIMIPALGIQNDPDYYPEPQKFDPDRFTEENKRNRPPFSWIPFGEGPRICIGMRFGIMQSKIALLTLLNNYELTLNKKTKMPVTFDKKELVSSPEGGVWIDLHKIAK